MSLFRRFKRGKQCSGEKASPEPANENYRMLDDGESPLELLLWIDQIRQEMREELAAEPELLTCPKHRKIRREVDAMEACFRWQQAQWN